MLRDLIRRSFWLAGGAAAGRLLPLAILLLASRRMETLQFASASAAYAWAGVAMSLTSAGLATVMTQRLAATTDGVVQARLFAHHVRLSIAWSGLLAVAVLVFGEPASARLFGAALDPAVLLPAALSGALWSQVVVCVAALNGCHRARAASAALAVCGLLQGAGIGMALHFFGPDAQASAWGLCIGSALACFFAVLLLRRALPIQAWRGASGAATPLAHPALPLWRNPVLWSTAAAAGAAPVSFFAGSLIAHGSGGGRQLAQYFALEQVHQLLVYLPAIVGQALLPLIGRRIGHTSSGRQRARLLRRVALVAAGAALVGLLIGAASSAHVGWFVALLGNPALGLDDAWSIRWMVLSAALALSLSITGGAFLGSGHIVAAGLFNLTWSAAFIGLTVLLSAQGNEGLQAARFMASAALATAAVLTLLIWAAREPTASQGALP